MGTIIADQTHLLQNNDKNPTIPRMGRLKTTLPLTRAMRIAFGCLATSAGLACAADGLATLRLSRGLMHATETRPAMPAPPPAVGTGAGALTLTQVLARALTAVRQGDAARAHYAAERAAGAVKLAEGAFDWALRSSTGYSRIYQLGVSGGFLTNQVETARVVSSSNFAERQLASGIRIRPGIVVSQTPENIRADLARTLNRPQLQIEVPLDRPLGQPADALRLEAARSELAAAQTDSEFTKQSYLHRVVAAAWMVVNAQEKAAIDLELAARIESVAARLGRLAGAGEVAVMAADDLRARAAFARSVAERTAVEVLAARMELAALLRLDPDRLSGVEAEFPPPGPEGTMGRERLDAFVAEALAKRPELRGQVDRIEAARLRGRIGEKEVESQLSMTLSQDRVFLNWSTPLGENRRIGARQQTAAGIGAAEEAGEDLRQRVKMETRLAFERLAAAANTISRARQAMAASREHYVLVGQLVESGRVAPSALADAANQLAAIRRQSVDARLLHALALADLRRATGDITEVVALDPAALARLFTTEP